jgi:hypothetical protein
VLSIWFESEPSVENLPQSLGAARRLPQRRCERRESTLFVDQIDFHIPQEYERAIYEVAVILVGGAVGMLAYAREIKPWSPKVGAAAALIGFAAAAASGELAESWAFVLFDVFQAWAVAIGAAALASALAHMRAPA